MTQGWLYTGFVVDGHKYDHLVKAWLLHSLIAKLYLYTICWPSSWTDLVPNSSCPVIRIQADISNYSQYISILTLIWPFHANSQNLYYTTCISSLPLIWWFSTSLHKLELVCLVLISVLEWTLSNSFSMLTDLLEKLMTQFGMNYVQFKYLENDIEEVL